jgi:hypothetical protein
MEREGEVTRIETEILYPGVGRGINVDRGIASVIGIMGQGAMLLSSLLTIGGIAGQAIEQIKQELEDLQTQLKNGKE